ncbi:conserved protein of unknown function [uncultured Woeseiaceae bacterium]|uniref:Uncharacterized protein n=1 Tax=uncultured Woeseiaceae bacterium TaxID=1983305 RepID=A0A7D9D1M5_9GAMM|nr:conserved protein of unknown function [uncultured Woeseiaceae bacterium]
MKSKATPMDDPSETARKLSAITDAGKFELLATSVLRAARPDLYGSLAQPGINVEGKTVKSPVDAIAYVQGAHPQHMVTAQHTICDRKQLKAKWLFDPSKAKPRKGKKPTTPTGDLIKTASIACEEREANAELRVTLALTTNREPPEDLIREAQRAANASGIMLDIWSCRILADYLDNEPQGQWLRRQYLGVEQERLSTELLSELSRESLRVNRPVVAEDQLVQRQNVRQLLTTLARPVAFLLGESGFGKTIACHMHLAEHIELGGCGLVLSHEILESASTIDQAVDMALRELHPELVSGAGADTLSLCSSDSPLLLVIEDVNKSSQASHVIQRLVAWSATAHSAKREGEQSWHAICPIRPELIGTISDDARKRIESLGAKLGRFDRGDAGEALLRRATSDGVEISALEAEAIADALDCDPLLVGLHEFGGDAQPAEVIERFISQSAERLAATNGSYTASEYDSALAMLASCMLEQQDVRPVWNVVVDWFENAPEQLNALRETAKQGAVLRIDGTDRDARIAFRHDRVCKWLIVRAVLSAILGKGLDEQTFSDPFFADVLGAALADPSVPETAIERARENNPLSLFYALKSFGEPNADAHSAILGEIDRWLSQHSTHTRKYQSLRYAALHVLSETQSSQVPPILAQFRDNTWPGSLAGLRNGDLRSGIELCYSLEPGSGALWRDYAIEHARTRFGPRLLEELNELLERPKLSKGEIVGGLRLAGHFGDSSLAGAIGECWSSDAGRMEHLDDYLWAAAQCGGEQTEEVLSPICDAWASLPNESEKEGWPSPRDDLAAHHVAWAFWRRLPTPALTFFIGRAAHDDLHWPILFMLHGVDHPDAVEFLAQQLAARARELEDADGFWPFMSTVRDHWRGWQGDRNRPMSQESRARLQDLWGAGHNDKHLRTQSFSLWAATLHQDDLAILQEQDCSDELSDEFMRARLERKDRTAIPLFIEKLRDDGRGFWWQLGRKIWSEKLTATLDQQLAERGESSTRKWDDNCDGDWIRSELLMFLSRPVAEELLCKHWDHLHFSPRYIQAALYVSGPSLLSLVSDAVRECPEPEKLFKFINMHFGIKTFGHPGVTRKEQVEGLIPYLDHMSDSDIFAFWELCNQRGWVDLRQDHFDSRLGMWRAKTGLDDETLRAELGRELTFDRTPWLDYWVERHLKDGRSFESILRVVRQWLKENRSAKAIEVAASIIIHAGSRSDLEILDDGNDGSPLAQEIIDDARFAVRRRTLT